MVGQLITPGGVSVSEALLRQGLAVVDLSDSCVPGQLLSCYDALNNTPAPPSNNNSTEEAPKEEPKDQQKETQGGFLFNPTGNGGNLQVTTLSNVGIVTVNGERGRKSGNKFNFSKPGCSYGRATVKGFTSTATATALSSSGKKSITLDGCTRRSE